MKKCTVVVPVYDEADGIERFHSSLIKVLDKVEGIDWSIIYINDGSGDNSIEILKNISKKEKIPTEVLDFSRNFGKEAATTAGIHRATAIGVDGAMILDADGQHPVTLIPSFIKKWKDGAEVIVGVRKNSQHEGVMKRIGSRVFYRSMRGLTEVEVVPGSTDFRFIDKKVADEFSKLTEHSRITRGLIDWLGFKRDYIEFEALEREYGTATYSVKKLFGLAINSYVSLSMVPLYISGYLGLVFIFLSTVLGLFIFIEQYLLLDPLSLHISGAATLGLLLVFLVGVILSSIGMMALYISRVLEEVQGRPLYIVRKK